MFVITPKQDSLNPRQKAEKQFNEFIQKHVGQVKDMTHTTGIKATDLLLFSDNAASADAYQLSLFDSKDDTLLYGELLTQAVELTSGAFTLIDLGCGSSIPTIMALSNTKRTDVKVIAVDIDPEALVVSKKNAEAHGIGSQYTFVQSKMSDFLSSFDFSSTKEQDKIMICTNPPYIATKPELSAKDRWWITVDGGEHGDKFIQEVLNFPYNLTESSPDLIFTILWPSLAYPTQIINTIKNHKYEVVYGTGTEIRFGKYTAHDELNPYLLNLREEGIVVFKGDNEDVTTQTHTIIGMILQAPKKQH